MIAATVWILKEEDGAIGIENFWLTVAGGAGGALGGGVGSYLLSWYAEHCREKIRRVEEYARQRHFEEMRKSKDTLAPILYNFHIKLSKETITFKELRNELGHDVRRIESMVEFMRMMSIQWRDDNVHRAYFKRLLGPDLST